MQYKYLDMQTYKRKDHFAYFYKMAYPYVGMTVNVDVTDLIGRIKAEKFFISTLPWIAYTALVQPTPVPADSNPRITWGKYFVQGDRVLLPVSVLCHHALVDGKHFADFYRMLEEEMRLIFQTRAPGLP